MIDNLSFIECLIIVILQLICAGVLIRIACRLWGIADDFGAIARRIEKRFGDRNRLNQGKKSNDNG